jgi:hypothetical protein
MVTQVLIAAGCLLAIWLLSLIGEWNPAPKRADPGWVEIRRLLGELCEACGPQHPPGCELFTEYALASRDAAVALAEWLRDTSPATTSVDLLPEDGEWHVRELTAATLLTPEACDAWVGRMRLAHARFGATVHGLGSPPDPPHGGGAPVPAAPA